MLPTLLWAAAIGLAWLAASTLIGILVGHAIRRMGEDDVRPTPHPGD
jgi:F0F1-type ATP synthase membrane subunit c/vacuolar-type H+-ATPase subunit K